jgi:hypothetical protein
MQVPFFDADLGLDLRAEPVVITMPVIENNRFFSVWYAKVTTRSFAV